MDVLLYALVQFVVTLEHLLEQFGHPRDDLIERTAEDNHRHNEDQAEAGVDDETHHDGENESERCPNGDAENLLIGVLQIVHVGGHPRHQSRCRILVDVAEGEALDIPIHRLAQVGGKAR